MVEGARLERVYGGNSIEGSNPSLTANQVRPDVLQHVAASIDGATLAALHILQGQARRRCSSERLARLV